VTEADKRKAHQKIVLSNFKSLLEQTKYVPKWVCGEEAFVCNGIDCSGCAFNSEGNLQALKDAIFGEE